MARVGITADQVAAAAEAIKGRSQTPTIAAIRAELGTGSFTTIAQYLAKWKTEGSLRADEELPLPEAVENAALQAISAIWRIAMNSAGDEVRALKSAHKEESDNAADAIKDAEAEIKRLEDRETYLETALEQLNAEAIGSANEVMRLTGEVQALHRAIELLKPAKEAQKKQIGKAPAASQ